MLALNKPSFVCLDARRCAVGQASRLSPTLDFLRCLAAVRDGDESSGEMGFKQSETGVTPVLRQASHE